MNQIESEPDFNLNHNTNDSINTSQLLLDKDVDLSSNDSMNLNISKDNCHTNKDNNPINNHYSTSNDQPTKIANTLSLKDTKEPLNPNTNRGLQQKYHNANTYKGSLSNKINKICNQTHQTHNSQINSRYNSLFNDSSINKSASQLDITDGSVNDAQIKAHALDNNPRPYLCESNSDIKNKIQELKNNGEYDKENSQISYYAKQIQDVKRDFSKD